MTSLRPIARSLVFGSIMLSVVSGSLSLFQYFSADEDKIFVIFTTAPTLSVVAGCMAIILLIYDTHKTRMIPTMYWAALSLAIATYWLSDFVLRDY